MIGLLEVNLQLFVLLENVMTLRNEKTFKLAGNLMQTSVFGTSLTNKH